MPNKAPQKHLFSRLHKWGIANDPAVVAERFTEACFVERFGRRRQSRLKTFVISAFSALKNSCLCVFCAFLWLKNPFNQRNLRLINDLRSTKDYVRKNNLFMQNKANFRKVKLNVNNVLTRNYDQMDTWSIRKTKPIQSQSKPIQSQLKPIKANSKPILCQNKPNLVRHQCGGTNPNKANFCTIASVYCLQLPLNAQNLLRNLVYGCQ
jgi:hypothetical protein